MAGLYALDDVEHAVLLAGEEDAVRLGGAMTAKILIDTGGLVGERSVAAMTAVWVCRRKDGRAALWPLAIIAALLAMRR